MHHWIHGAHGTGKTTLAKQLAAKPHTIEIECPTKAALIQRIGFAARGTTIIIDGIDSSLEWLPLCLRDIGSGRVVLRGSADHACASVDTSGVRVIVFANYSPWTDDIAARMHRKGLIRVMPISSAVIAHRCGSL